MRVEVPTALLERIYAYARAAFPAECCGYVRGDPPDEVVACTNAAAAAPERHFAIDGRELFDFARSFDTDRPACIVYHSHPNGRAYFSATDRELATAYPVQHLVVGVTAERVTEAAQFTSDGHELARWSP